MPDDCITINCHSPQYKERFCFYDFIRVEINRIQSHEAMPTDEEISKEFNSFYPVTRREAEDNLLIWRNGRIANKVMALLEEEGMIEVPDKREVSNG